MKQWKPLVLSLLIALLGTACARGALPASSTPGVAGVQVTPAPDFAGKTVRVIVGFAPGGGYDTYARTIAQHLGKHVPGNPTVIVENLEGGGSLVSANYLARSAQPDGLTLGVFNSSLVLQAALGAKGTQFTGKEFGWIGAPSRGIPACAFIAASGVRTWQDAVAANRELKMGATSVGSTTGDLPRILDKVTAANFRMVEGYEGTSEIRRALQAGEVDGACWGWEFMKITAQSMLDAQGDDKLIPVLVQGDVTDPKVQNVPQISSVIMGAEEQAMFRAWMAPYRFQRPFALPPNTPASILDVYRDAFAKTLQDPAFQADAQRAKLDLDPVEATEIKKAVEDIWSMPPGAKEQLQFLVVGG